MSIKFNDVSYVYLPSSPYEFEALKHVNLELKEGKITALIGHTGSGKSTLVQHINGLILPSSGEVVIDEFTLTNKVKIKGIKKLRKHAGMVFQFPEYQLFEETVYKDIIFGPKNFGVKDEELDNIAKNVIKMVGLDETYLERSPFELSGGQKRRVAIAGILALDPDILVLDEPTAGLDPIGAKEMMDLFKKLNDLGKTIIMVTHEMDFVLKYADEVVVMKEGEIKAQTDPISFFYDDNLLKEVIIEEPQVITFTKKLLKNGLNVDFKKIKDIDSLLEQIVSIKGGANNE